MDGAVLVTTPQAVALGDVRRQVTFCRRAGLRIIGIVENMSGYVCPHCSECTDIFSKGGGKVLAEHASAPFLGAIPIEPKLAEAADAGIHFVDAFEESETAKKLGSVVDQIMENWI